MIHHYKTVESTNTLAVQMAGRGAEHGTVVWADRQTAGRGRSERIFLSPPGGLYFSLILRPPLSSADFPLITLATGVGLCTGIAELTPVRPLLKWPNDLYLQERKLSGILCESGPAAPGGLPGYVVIGVGINLNTAPEQFPSSLRKAVISLYHHSADAEIDRKRHLTTFVQAIDAAVSGLARSRQTMLADWRTRDFLKGRSLEYSSPRGTVSATGIGLADDGQYIIRDTQGREHRVMAGDLNPIRVIIR